MLTLRAECISSACRVFERAIQNFPPLVAMVADSANPLCMFLEAFDSTAIKFNTDYLLVIIVTVIKTMLYIRSPIDIM